MFKKKNIFSTPVTLLVIQNSISIKKYAILFTHYLNQYLDFQNNVF